MLDIVRLFLALFIGFRHLKGVFIVSENKKNLNIVSMRKFSLIAGVSNTTITNAVKTGRLKNCVVYDDKGEMIGLDREKAVEEWRSVSPETKFYQTLREAEAPGAPKPQPYDPAQPFDEMDYQKSRSAREFYAAQIAKLEFEKMAETLIEADAVSSEWVKIASAIKTKMLSVPSKLRSRIPHLTLDDIATIEDEIREALEELSENANSD